MRNIILCFLFFICSLQGYAQPVLNRAFQLRQNKYYMIIWTPFRGIWQDVELLTPIDFKLFVDPFWLYPMLENPALGIELPDSLDVFPPLWFKWKKELILFHEVDLKALRKTYPKKIDVECLDYGFREFKIQL